MIARLIVLCTWMLTTALGGMSLFGCGADGGVGGTGISATINGNVAAGGATAFHSASVDATDIRVRIQGTTIETTPDPANGWFELQGEFAGDVTVEFVEDALAPALLGLDVPAGGTVTLDNVRIDRVQRQARADGIRVDFEAVALEDAVCSGADGTVSVRDRSPGGNVFRIRVSADTDYEDDNDPEATRSCSDLHNRQTLRVRGTESGGVIAAERVRLTRSRSGGGAGQLPR